MGNHFNDFNDETCCPKSSAFFLFVHFLIVLKQANVGNSVIYRERFCWLWCIWESAHLVYWPVM